MAASRLPDFKFVSDLRVHSTHVIACMTRVLLQCCMVPPAGPMAWQPRLDVQPWACAPPAGAIKHHYNSYAHAIMALAGVTATACVLVYHLPLPGFRIPAPRLMSQTSAAAVQKTSDDGATTAAPVRLRDRKGVEQD